jgi:hypothetical protein
MALINWLLKPKCMLEHILNFCCMKIRCDFLKKTWSHARKQDIFFVFIIFFFATFQRKPSILIPDSYLYSIKIQTNIKKNLVEKYWGKS